MSDSLEILESVNGVGNSTVGNFRDAGFESPHEIGQLSIEELRQQVDRIGYKTASKVLATLDKHGYRNHDVNKENLRQLIDLLEQLFEFDKKDRDFGVYKLMNQRRDEIDHFINTELVEYIKQEVSELKDEIGGQDDFKEKRNDLIDALGENALRADGGVRDEYRSAPVAQEYIEARQQDDVSLENIEAEIYNHIYEFFDRYYDNGDFITQEYEVTGDQPYSVPYDGSNTNFHWATKNQYYAKTSEQFTRFSFKHNGDSYIFQTENAELVDESSVGDSSYFLLDEVDENTVTFKRRQVGESDFEEHGVSKNKKKKQGAFNEAFADELSEQFAVSRDVLKAKLDEYTARNQNDFFIHKDLDGFLTQELERYVRDEVASYDPMDGFDGINAVDRAKGQIVNDICVKIIRFITQINEFKRKVFEKQKFVTDSYNLVPIAEIDEEHYDTILSNEEQRDRWQERYGVEDVTADELERPPYNRMMVDSGLFEESFVSEEPDNLLVRGENYQAQEFLREKYENSVKCIYIDPPYNTGNSNFAYRDNYQRPTWLSMMYDRLRVSRNLLENNGTIFVSIDNRELKNLELIMNQIFGEENKIGTFVWKKRSPQNDVSNMVSTDHEYVLAYSGGSDVVFKGQEKEYSGYSNRDDDPRGEWRSTDLKDPSNTKEDRPEAYYKLKDPTTGKEYGPAVWAHSKDSMEELIEDDKVWFPSDTNKTPRRKLFKHEVSNYKPVSTWIEPVSVDSSREESIRDITILNTGFTSSGTRNTKNIFGGKAYDYPKPVKLIEELISQVVNDGDIVLDFFAGSGTTAQAVQELNLVRDEQVNYIMVEMLDEAFDITEERVKRLAYSDEWKDGEPQVDENTTLDDFDDDEQYSPIPVKCLELESYEQALDVVDFTREQSTLAKHTDHLLNYMLDFGTKSSPTLLDAEQLSNPTEYELNLDAQDNITADVMTTFRYLLGLQDVTEEHRTIEGIDYTLHTGSVEQDDGVDDVLVVWRHDGSEASYEAEVDELDVDEFDTVYVNGDSAFENGELIAPKFEQLMFGDKQ